LSEVERQQLRIADEARSDDKKAAKMAAMGAVVGGAIGSVIPGAGTMVGAAVGGMLGGAVGGSWLCTETEKKIGLDEYTIDALRRFRRYAVKNHRQVMKYYLKVGPQLIEKIYEKDNACSTFEHFKENVINPVVVHTDSSQPEIAYQIYKQRVIELIREFLPDQLQTALLTERVDEFNLLHAGV